MPETFPVDRLLLDDENPRLPPELFHAGQAEIFAYLYDNGVLEEIVSSMLDNGFFITEPLIVLEEKPDGTRVVVEGNRRLAALMLIHGLPPASGFETFGAPTPENLASLREIPIVEAPGGRLGIRAYLGYRHISGLKPWPAEAKARYVAKAVQAAIEKGDRDPFAAVGKEVGSNALGVRNSYIAFVVLRAAREQCGAENSYVLNHRFGVWLRCLNSPEIRSYIGLGDPRTYEEVSEAVERLDCANLPQVVRDLTRIGDQRPLVADSRQVTAYGQVLVDESAHAILRRYGSLEVAAEAVRSVSIATRVMEIEQSIMALRTEVEHRQNLDDAAVDAVKRLSTAARLLAASIETLVAK